jgi:hypothetical protein
VNGSGQAAATGIRGSLPAGHYTRTRLILDTVHRREVPEHDARAAVSRIVVTVPRRLEDTASNLELIHRKINLNRERLEQE